MRSAPAVAALLVVLLAACGDPAAEDEGGPAPLADTPRSGFDAVMRAVAGRDWHALYQLHAPSERREAERRWDAIRLDRERWQDLATLADEIDATKEQVAAMTLREVFVRRQHLWANDPDSRIVEYASDARYLDAEPTADGALRVRFLLGYQSEEMLMRKERGRWYVWQELTDLVDLAEPW